MHVNINLASQPFRRDRPIVVGTVVAALTLVVLLGVLTSLAMSDTARLKDTRRSVDLLQQSIRKLTSEQARLEAIMRRPENAEVLERSVFLNSLLYRKGISWTRIFSDLEKVTPHNVRIISIRPSVNNQNQITLEMQVGAETQEPVLKMIMALESSDLFGSTFVYGYVPPTQNEPLFRYRISANYVQKL